MAVTKGQAAIVMERKVIRSLQLRVLHLGFFQDGDVGVGFFPECEEIFVGGESPDAGGIGIRSLRGSRLQSVGTRHSQMRQRSRPTVPDNAAVIEDFLELGGGGTATACHQICLAAQYSHLDGCQGRLHAPQESGSGRRTTDRRHGIRREGSDGRGDEHRGNCPGDRAGAGPQLAPFHRRPGIADLSVGWQRRGYALRAFIGNAYREPVYDI